MGIESPQTKEYVYIGGELECDLLILAAGFEDRAYEFICNSNLNQCTKVILVAFNNDISINDETYSKYLRKLESIVPIENIEHITIDQHDPRNYSSRLEQALIKLSNHINNIWVDISGMPTHAICTTLKFVRDFSSSQNTNVIYTSAKQYHPSKKEYEILKKKQSEGVEYLPSSMAKEMAENLILNCFSGQRTNEGQSCLALFAGYEIHRSAGVIENVNPSLILFLYGKPEGRGLNWRLDLSKQLHSKFQNTRKSAMEEVSTLYPQESLDYLEQYYEYLYDDYDLTIAPVCSKMHAVSAYLFWEKYREVQLIFPLPISYMADKKASKVDKTYLTIIPPRNTLFDIQR